MITQDINSSDKSTYFSPMVKCIKLDNEISLQLQSPGTPDNGDEVVYNTPQYFNKDPFKTNLG